MCVLLCAVSSGSVTVNADSSVQLLAEEAVSLDQLDVAVSAEGDLHHFIRQSYKVKASLKFSD